MYAQVALPLPLPALTYKIPPGLQVEPGTPVKARVRKKLFDGVVMEVLAQAPAGAAKFEIKALEGISDEFPILDTEARRALEWAADYYHYPIGEVLRTILPPDPSPKKRAAYRLTPAGRSQFDSGSLPKGKKQREVLEIVTKGDSVSLPAEQRDAAKRLCEAGWLERFTVDDETLPDLTPVTSVAPTLTDYQARAVSEIGQEIEQ
jgi:primosomal protein N' (replication factor Y)